MEEFSRFEEGVSGGKEFRTVVRSSTLNFPSFPNSLANRIVAELSCLLGRKRPIQWIVTIITCMDGSMIHTYIFKSGCFKSASSVVT